MRFTTRLSIPLAAVLAFPAPAEEVLILESGSPAYPAGTVVDDAAPVTLRRTERLVFIGADGVTREVVGRFDGALGDEEALEENRRELRRGVWRPIGTPSKVERPDPVGRDSPVGAVAGIGGDGGAAGPPEGDGGGKGRGGGASLKGSGSDRRGGRGVGIDQGDMVTPDGPGMGQDGAPTGSEGPGTMQ